VSAVRILLVSQMYPGPDDPDLGAFVQAMEGALAARGHELERAVVEGRGGGRRRHLGLARRARAAARRFRPDVLYAHFLVPTGLAAALAAPRTPLVVTAHGQDVANVGRVRGVRAATRLTVRRAAAVVAVSDWVCALLEEGVPEARGKTEVVSMGVDLDRFALLPRTEDGARPAFVCIGSLTERKNVVRLAEAFERLGEGSLTFVGDGPLRGQLEGRPGVRLVGAVAQSDVPGFLAAADVVCQPSLVEPFGLAALEAMAAGRSVVATRVGGPPEFVPPAAGVLVDPEDVDAIAAGMRAATALPSPNDAARAAAAEHDLRRQAARVEAILARAARLQS
jgi:glycosyltransferase involved in cell wall biosynthesis